MEWVLAFDAADMFRDLPSDQSWSAPLSVVAYLQILMQPPFLRDRKVCFQVPVFLRDMLHGLDRCSQLSTVPGYPGTRTRGPVERLHTNCSEINLLRPGMETANGETLATVNH